LKLFIILPLGAITPAAIVLPMVKRNWRRFGRGDVGERCWSSTVVYLAWKTEGTRCAAGFKPYHFPCKQFSSATIPAEWIV